MIGEKGFRPGDLIITNYGTYGHYSVVSDKKCHLGRWMLISATARTNTVKEEPYSDVVCGRPTRLAQHQPMLPVSEVLHRARSQIGKWDYRLWTQNCEHFANWAAGLERSSPQVKSAIIGAATFAGSTAMIVKKPNLTLLLGVGIVGGLVGLSAAQRSAGKQVLRCGKGAVI